MGTTFVRIKDYGFWVNDGILELWLRFLSLHIEEPIKRKDLARNIRDQWLLASKGFFVGCVPANIEIFVKQPRGKEIIIKASNSLLSTLKRAPSTLSKDVLNLLGIRGVFTQDFETWRLIDVGNAFINLIKGKITTKASDTSFIPGYGKSEDLQNE